MLNPERSVANRLRVHWPAKLALGILLALFFCACYFAIGHNPIRLPARLQLTALDRWVAFSPGWVWAYQSLYLLLPVAWLCETTDQLRRYAIGFLILSSIGFLCFLLWPVAGPRPPEIRTCERQRRQPPGTIAFISHDAFDSRPVLRPSPLQVGVRAAPPRVFPTHTKGRND